MFAATLAMFSVIVVMMTRNHRSLIEDNNQFTVWRERGVVTFEWRDVIQAPMADILEMQFEDQKKRARRFVIELDSQGGALAEGREVIEVMERMKRTHQVDTRVGEGGICYSMCVPIFLVGENRMAVEDARFMFHEPKTYEYFTGKKQDVPDFEQEMTSQRFFSRYFVNSPMDAVWREKLAAQWKGKDLYYTAAELVAQNSNIVTELQKKAPEDAEDE